MSLPLWRTDKEAARGIPLPAFVEAGLVAWLVPPVIGYLAMVAIRLLESDALGVAGLGFVVMMSAIFSPVGIVPGVIAMVVMLRKGVGGLAAILLVGVGICVVMSALITGFDTLFQPLFVTMSLFYAAFTWLYLYARRKEQLIAPRVR